MASVETASKSAAFLVRYHARVGLGAKREVRAIVGSMAGDMGACTAGRGKGDGGGGSTEGGERGKNVTCVALSTKH